MRKYPLLILSFLTILASCADDSDYGSVSVAYMEAQTYSDSILRTRKSALTIDPHSNIALHRDLLLPESKKSPFSGRADLGGSPTAGIFIEWYPDPDAEGYIVYAGDRTSGLARVTNFDTSHTNYYFNIPNPDFDTEYGIRIEAIKTGYYPKSSGIHWIPLLGEYTLSLSSPGDYATIYGQFPTFTWTADPVPGSTGRLDYFKISQVNGPLSFQSDALRNTTSFSYNYVPLSRGSLYEWDIFRSITFKIHNDNATKISISFPRTHNSSDDIGSNNGCWYLTITE